MNDPGNIEKDARLQAIKEQGSKDYHRLRGVLSIPYGMGTPEYDAYERGWSQALKRCSEPFGTWASSGWCPDDAGAKPQVLAQPKINEYERRKG